MAQEFFINSQKLEDKVRTLLPSQGGAEAGFDLSASTQIVPIINLTESAEGSQQRADLQSALFFKGATEFDVSGTTSTIISNTGYWRIFGTCTVQRNGSGAESASIILNDGSATKTVWKTEITANTAQELIFLNLDFIIFLSAGDSLQMETTNAECFLQGSVRQLASIDGTLVSPS